MDRRHSLVLFGGMLLAVAPGCGGASRGTVMPTSIDTTRALTALDPRQPFELWLGRGSATQGLETFYMGPRGETVLYRQHTDAYGLVQWQRATTELPPSEILELRTSIANHGLLGLERVYRNGTGDGTQWVLAIVQGDAAHVTLFDDVFPEEARGFAYDLDMVLGHHRLDALPWQPVSEEDAQRHDDALWEATRR